SLAGGHGARARQAIRQRPEREPVVAMLVAPRQHVQAVVPSAVDQDIARSIVVRAGLGKASAVAEDLDLDVAGLGLAHGVEADADIARQAMLQPNGPVERAFTAQ